MNRMDFGTRTGPHPGLRPHGRRPDEPDAGRRHPRDADGGDRSVLRRAVGQDSDPVRPNPTTLGRARPGGSLVIVISPPAGDPPRSRCFLLGMTNMTNTALAPGTAQGARTQGKSDILVEATVRLVKTQSAFCHWFPSRMAIPGGKMTNTKGPQNTPWYFMGCYVCYHYFGASGKRFSSV